MACSIWFPKCDVCNKTMNSIDIDLCNMSYNYSYIIKSYCSLKCKIADSL